MKITSYEEYQELLSSAPEKHYIKNIDFYIQKNKKLEAMMDMMPSAMLISNYRTSKFLFVSKSVKSITGDDAETTMQSNILDLQSRVHPDDIKILSSHYLTNLIKHVSQIEKDELKSFVFSINYRVKRTDGFYIQILQRTIILETNQDNLPMLTMSNLTDISNYKSDNTMVFTVSKFDENNCIFNIHRDILGEDDLSMKLTTKEIEILLSLSNGLSAKEIAETQSLSEFTVKAHIRNLKNKLNIHKISELVSYALSNKFHFK